MSTTNNIAQARKLVEQLRIEAGFERIKVGAVFERVMRYHTNRVLFCCVSHT